MWNWKQLQVMKHMGWDVYGVEQGNSRISTKLKRLIFFWNVLVTVLGQAIYLLLSLRNGKYGDSVTSITELATTSMMAFKVFKWAYQCNEIASIIKDIEELDKRRKMYDDRDDNRTDSIMNVHTKACSKGLYYITVGCLLSCAHWTVGPIASALHGELTPILRVWVPWDETAWAGWLVVFIQIAVSEASCVSGMIAYDTLTISFNELTIGLVESICYGLSNLKFQNTDARQRLCELHKMHEDALNITKKVKCFTNWVIQADAMGFTLRMCCGVLEITRDWASTNKKINTIEICVFFAFMFFIQCYKCQMVTTQFMNVGWAAYNNDWYRATAAEKRSLSIIVEMSRTPVEFGSIIRIDVNTFITVMKTSFSYYNALKAFDIH